MPYYRRRRYGYKRRYYGGKRYRRRGITYSQIGTKVYRDLKKLKSLVNVEFKSSDTNISTTTSTTQTYTLLNGLTKGDDIANRDGRSVRFKSLQFNIVGTINASATDTRLRWAIFIDKQPNASAPASGDLYDDAIQAFRNLNNRKRFVILKSGLMIVNTDFPEKNNKRYFRMNMHTIYNGGNAGTIADINSNALYLFLVSDEATNAITVSGKIRLRFIDN